ncbi:MAG: hypothetical protein JNJ57_08445, partial [Saprospiraceae bacterium]|nr:hypothetical protein [Saprospiraceae bacterium]
MKNSLLLKLFVFGTLLLCATLAGCIKEDDGAPEERNLPTIQINDFSISEDDTDQTIAFEVALSGNNPTNAVVKFAAVSGTAVSPDDYEILTTGQLVFTPGQTSKVIEIKIKGDEVKEPSESFQLKLYNPLNVKLVSDVAVITIADDDDNTAGLVIPTGGYTSPASYPGYNLVWSDEFDGTALNPDFWTFETGGGGWGNNELQYYREDNNTTLQNGNLIITAKKQKFASNDYTSSRI